MSRVPPTVCLFLVITALVITGGCSHYQLGSAGRTSFRTLYVEPVTNRTLLPQAPVTIAAVLRSHLARDARITLARSADEADVTLALTLTDYQREIAAVRSGDTGLARKFNVSLTATCTLRENRGGKMILEKYPVRAVREVFTDSGQLQAEFQALPLLAETLAEKIIQAAFNTW